MMCASAWCEEHETFGCRLDEACPQCGAALEPGSGYRRCPNPACAVIAHYVRPVCPAHGTPLVEHAGWIACRSCLENATEES